MSDSWVHSVLSLVMSEKYKVNVNYFPSILTIYFGRDPITSEKRLYVTRSQSKDRWYVRITETEGNNVVLTEEYICQTEQLMCECVGRLLKEYAVGKSSYAKKG